MEKYPEIENSYRTEWIEHFLPLYPKLHESRFVIQEKIHGANIRVEFTPNGSLNIGSREQENIEDFEGARTVLAQPEYESLIELMCKEANTREKPILLHGEIFGPKIQKGVNYGDKKRILFFDARIDGQLLSQYDFEHIVPEQFRVKVVGRMNTLKEALAFPNEFPSNYSPTNDICEGVVIKPYDDVFYNKVGEIFYIKNKNEKFHEKKCAKKEPKEIPDRINPLLEYINENRMDSVFSKKGHIIDKKQMKDYILAIVEDAVKDCLKDNPALELTSNERVKAGNAAAQLLLRSF